MEMKNKEMMNGGMHSCAGCEFMRMYDYGKKIYYCDHEDRTDDIGKLSEGDLPGICPEWCPLRNKE